MLWRRHRTPITSGVPSSRSCPILKGWYCCTWKVTATIVVILDCTVGISHCSDRRRHLPIRVQVGDTVGGEDPGQHSPGAAIAVPVAIDVATTGSRVIPEEQAEVIFVSGSIVPLDTLHSSVVVIHRRCLQRLRRGRFGPSRELGLCLGRGGLRLDVAVIIRQDYLIVMRVHARRLLLRRRR